MKFDLSLRLLAAGAVCLIALVALVVREGQARAAGTEVVLDMQPVDPRSLLSGHFVMFNFVTALAPDEACPPIAESQPSMFDRHPQSWVALKRRGDRHIIAAVTRTRDEAAAAGDVVVQGDATCDAPTPPGKDSPGGPGLVRLTLAIDRFHADQDEAEAIDAAVRDRTTGEARVAAVVSVGADGVPRTKGLIVDGRRIDLTW